MAQLTQEELTKIGEISQKQNNLIQTLGQIQLQKEDLKEQEEEIFKLMKELKIESIQLANDLQTRYGEGNINIQTGEFTPVQ